MAAPSKKVDMDATKKKDEVAAKNKKDEVAVTNKKDEVAVTNKKDEVAVTNKKDEVATTNKKDEKESDAPKETFEPFANPMQDYVEKHLQPFSKMIRVMPHDVVIVSSYEPHHEKHLAFPCRSTDVWVASFPKSGTTWTQELTWCIERGLDHKDGEKPLMNRFPFFEWDCLITSDYDAAMALLPDDNVERRGEQWKLLDTDVNPRLIKTHLHRELLPRGVRKEKSKIIFVVRDPRDLCISLYYHTIKFLDYTGDFEHFVKLFLADAYEYGSFWNTVLSYWKVREADNILFVRYEELQEDLSGMIKKIGSYLGRTVTPEQVAAMIPYLDFDYMKKNPATNNEKIMDGVCKPSDIKFMRKGIVGDHMNHLNEAQMVQFKTWTENWLKDSDFPYYRDW